MSRTSQVTERQALLILNALPEVGPVTLRRLMDAFEGDPRRILAAPASELKRVQGVGDTVANVLKNWCDLVSPEKEESQLKKAGARFVTFKDEDYPPLLKEIYDPPIGLYWKGGRIAERCIAMVGTRRPTLYGQTIARKLAANLTRCGFCVVSGLARGIDTAAHEGALSAGGKTIAVLGCGLDIIYPAENLDLYRRIAGEGAVVSEFPFGRRADRQSFPMRNRVVAGICDGLIVVESAVNGGSMITARFAAEQGRTVLAVPGRVDQASSHGCHQLIRDGAVLVQDVDEVMEEFAYLKGLRPSETEEGNAGAQETVGPALSDLESAVMDVLKDGSILNADEIARQTGLPGSTLASALMMLELKRLLAKRADGTFEVR